VQELYQDFLNEGFEGAIIRSKYGIYKCGRSTLKQGILLKFKRSKDSEAIIVGFIEKEHNLNTAKKDAFGNIKRSSHKAGKVAANTLGALVVKDVNTGIEFNVGTGFNDKLRALIWKNRKKYKGEIIKYEYQEEGSKDKPRFPCFLGFRCEDDL
jgi:DNA ligase-1